MVIKGRNRDTAWFAVIDSEWPALKTAYQTWLDHENFDASGQQHISLSALTSDLRNYQSKSNPIACTTQPDRICRS